MPDYENLPMRAEREKLIGSLKKNNCLIIKGKTGSGKTTQVPLFILDDHVKQNKLGIANG